MAGPLFGDCCLLWLYSRHAGTASSRVRLPRVGNDEVLVFRASTAPHALRYLDIIV